MGDPNARSGEALAQAQGVVVCSIGFRQGIFGKMVCCRIRKRLCAAAAVWRLTAARHALVWRVRCVPDDPWCTALLPLATSASVLTGLGQWERRAHQLGVARHGLRS